MMLLTSMGPGRSWLAILMLVGAVLIVAALVRGQAQIREIRRRAAEDEARAARWAREAMGQVRRDPLGGAYTWIGDDGEDGQ